MAKNTYFSILPNTLPKNDPRYKKWLESLKKRPASWIKGKTKFTDPRVKKISDTFKRKKIDNFARWREKAIKEGKIIANYPPFKKTEVLAALIGLVLGDGNIYAFPRTEKLTIALGTDKPELIKFTENLVGVVFKKPPKTLKLGSNAVRITLYQKKISERLGVPGGSRRYLDYGLPKWIWSSNRYLIACLKGLFEAEGSFSIHPKTGTYNFAFSNKNSSLLNEVERGLLRLGFHPERRTYAVRLRKKKEAFKFEKLISFRSYF